VNVSPVDPWAIILTPNSFTVQQIQTDVDSLTREQVRSLYCLFKNGLSVCTSSLQYENIHNRHLLRYMSTIKEIHEMKGVVAFHYYDYKALPDEHVAGDSLTLLSCISILSTN
jgi:hypothetical protein